ncbi:HNH endonuclease [Streptomyces sp. NPDC048297]
MQPLALGGEDTDGNVQPLCHVCHLVKTAEDFPFYPTPY